MSSRRLQDMSWKHLEDVFAVTIFRLLRGLARCLQDVFKTSWKTKYFYAEDVLKRSSRHFLKTSSRRLEDQQMFAEENDKNINFVMKNKNKNNSNNNNNNNNNNKKVPKKYIKGLSNIFTFFYELAPQAPNFRESVNYIGIILSDEHIHSSQNLMISINSLNAIVDII